MYLIVVSKQDPASLNICEHLLERPSWVQLPELKFDGNEVFTLDKTAALVRINDYHLFVDDIDAKVKADLAGQGFDLDPAAVLFPSKHRSESGMKTLTVHPVGNYTKEAKFGGLPEQLVPTAPHIMTEAYRRLYQNAQDEYNGKPEYSVTFEVTHHGPYLETPSFFIEIGSDEAAWGDRTAASVIARTIMDILTLEPGPRFQDFQVGIGIGGGHYAPRHSDVVRKKRLSIGHMIPTYALDAGLAEEMLLQACARTPGTEVVYFHRKALKKAQYRKLLTWFEAHRIKPVRAGDLEEI